jgi:teichoic acid transport system permease protein
VASESRTVQRVYDASRRMPEVRPYLAETIEHVMFAYEKSRLDLKAAHKDTWFGRLWNVLNPLLLGMVYWLLVQVIFSGGGDDPYRTLAQILGGLFLFSFPSGALSLGARSIVSGGTFVLNTRIPRLILPIGSTISAFLNFVPSLLIYALIHVVAGLPIGPQLLWVLPILALLCVISLGLATTFATLNVYFRDVAAFLPYVTRIWMYLTPIIYLYTFFPEDIRWVQHVNPLGGLFTALQQVLIDGASPSASYVLSATGWSFGILVLGVYLFLRRERDFAVRI